MPRKHLFIIASIAIILTAILGWFVAPEVVTRNQTMRSTGKALIGGEFTLTDNHGQTVTDAALQGNYSLIVFGYTFCPDVCPTELSTLTAALDGVEQAEGSLPDNLKAYFVTIDPERDTVEQMASYVSNFHPLIAGLTGTVEQVEKAAKAYRVYYAKVVDEDSAAEYLMDHSALIFLMGPDGEYLKHYNYGTPPEEITQSLLGFMS